MDLVPIGDLAADSIRGVNVASFAMSFASLLLVVLAVFGPDRAKPCQGS